MNPKALTQAAKQIQNWQKRRDDLIVKARADGYSLREIAEMAGLTHTAVAAILRRRA